MAETVGDIGEFELIDRIVARLPRGVNTLVGPGDDAAVIATPAKDVVATTDVLVDGRHFRRDWSGAEDVGRRAAAASLADVAAMGAVPTALLVALCAPPDLPLAWVEELTDGFAAECAVTGASVVGGDVSSSPTLTISVTALGDLGGRLPVLRSGAQPGQMLAVAGRLGWAAAGYAVLARGFRSPRALVEAYRWPEPPYWAGPAAAGLGATSMIDISDGLLAECAHLAQASGVRINVAKASVPVADQVRDAAAALSVDPYDWVLRGGDDHALLATFPPEAPLGDGWTVLGTVTQGKGITVDGETPTGELGWRHFSK